MGRCLESSRNHECAVLPWFPALAVLSCAPGWLLLSLGDAFTTCCSSLAGAVCCPWAELLWGLKGWIGMIQEQEMEVELPIPESFSLATASPSGSLKKSKWELHPPHYEVHCNPKPARAGGTYSFVFRDQMEDVMMFWL